MLMYGLLGWNFFRDSYEYDGMTFKSTVLYTVLYGMNQGEGVMGKLKPPAWSDRDEDFVQRDYFWNRYVFDITFFIIINMLFMKMLFGIIIDTFKELSE